MIFHFSFDLRAKVWKIDIEKSIFWQFSWFGKISKMRNFSHRAMKMDLKEIDLINSLWLLKGYILAC